jgi:hypothetical protein
VDGHIEPIHEISHGSIQSKGTARQRPVRIAAFIPAHYDRFVSQRVLAVGHIDRADAIRYQKGAIHALRPQQQA